jgi:hypothetical protein
MTWAVSNYQKGKENYFTGKTENQYQLPISYRALLIIPLDICILNSDTRVNIVFA